MTTGFRKTILAAALSISAFALAATTATAQSNGARPIPSNGFQAAPGSGDIVPPPAAPTMLPNHLTGPSGLVNIAMTERKAEGFRKFLVRTVRPYLPGETIHLYAEPMNFGWSQIAMGYRFHLSTVIEIHDANGRILHRLPIAKDITGQTTDPRNIHITFGFKLPENARPGIYTITFIFTDPVNNRTVSVKRPFAVDSGRHAGMIDG
ncbi:MAG TPA: hypothetical protein PK264_00955 [Hyphomicrobiaceae bacterium]|nr:hypothetical protein [Hyphomicrobiaceae bacterium]